MGTIVDLALVSINALSEVVECLILFVKASLEVPADFLTMHKGERSRLQNLAIQLADKVNSIMEMNEKLIDNRGGMISGPKGSFLSF